MVLTTRPISWRTEDSRSLVLGLPWKYLLTTILVAVCDQFLGTSTPSWRKMLTPFSLPMAAVRFSPSTESNGEIFPSVKKRSNTRPAWVPAVLSGLTPVCSDFAFNAGFTVAIPILQTRASPSGGYPYIFLLCRDRGLPSFSFETSRSDLTGEVANSRIAL